MPKQTYRYKVTGKVAFSVDDILGENLEEAKDDVTSIIGEHLAFAATQRNIEILEMHLEKLGPCETDALGDIVL